MCEPGAFAVVRLTNWSMTEWFSGAAAARVGAAAGVAEDG